MRARAARGEGGVPLVWIVAAAALGIVVLGLVFGGGDEPPAPTAAEEPAGSERPRPPLAATAEEREISSTASGGSAWARLLEECGEREGTFLCVRSETETGDGRRDATFRADERGLQVTRHPEAVSVLGQAETDRGPDVWALEVKPPAWEILTSGWYLSDPSLVSPLEPLVRLRHQGADVGGDHRAWVAHIGSTELGPIFGYEIYVDARPSDETTVVARLCVACDSRSSAPDLALPELETALASKSPGYGGSLESIGGECLADSAAAFLCYQTQAGSGHHERVLVTSEEAAFRVGTRGGGSEALRLEVESAGRRWVLTFDPPGGDRLQSGRYSSFGAAASPGRAGFALAGADPQCAVKSAGTVEILQAARNEVGRIERVDLVFGLQCPQSFVFGRTAFDLGAPFPG